MTDLTETKIPQIYRLIHSEIETTRFYILAIFKKVLLSAYHYSKPILSFHLKNMKYINKNLYEIVPVHYKVSDYTIIYENIEYSGIQMGYNRNGHVVYEGQNNAKITDHEIAESWTVTFDKGSQWNFEHTAGHSSIWSVSGVPTMTVKEQANVYLHTTNDSCSVFSTEGTSGNFIVEKGASFVTTGAKPFTDARHLNNGTVGENATLKLNGTSGTTTLTVKQTMAIQPWCRRRDQSQQRVCDGLPGQLGGPVYR